MINQIVPNSSDALDGGVLAIGGWDPTGSAGVARDLLTAREWDVPASGVITSIVIQDSLQVHRVVALDRRDVLQQLQMVTEDIPFAVWKVGVVPNLEIANLILEMAAVADVDLVVDPVLWSGDGTLLVPEADWDGLRRLLAIASISTPNYGEAKALAGSDTSAAQLAVTLAPESGWCVVTGGDSSTDEVVVDWASDGADALPIERPRVKAGWVRGTGCAMGSAIAAQLARGSSPLDSIRGSGDWLAGRLSEVRSIGSGGARLW